MWLTATWFGALGSQAAWAQAPAPEPQAPEPPTEEPPTEGAPREPVPTPPSDAEEVPTEDQPESQDQPAPPAEPPPPDDPPSPPFAESGEDDEGFVLAPSRMSPAERQRLSDELRGYHGPFAQGRLRISVVFGGGTNFRDNYLILGAGVGYFLLDGLEASLGGTAWVLGDPFIGTVTPGLTYVFYQVPKIHPYLGAFYRHYFITGDFDDFDTYGGRAGVNLLLGNEGFIGGGVVYERLFDCQDDEIWEDCDQWYPELTFAFVF